jgi:hypothetical protein
MFSILAIIICQLSNAYTVPKFIFFIFFIGFEIGPDQILFVSTVEILPEFGVSFCFAFQWLCQLFILLSIN